MMAALVHRDIEIRGTVYPDAKAAAAALGLHPTHVRAALREGRADRLGLGRQAMPVRVRGKVFADAGAAAAHFGVSRSAILSAIGRGTEDRYLGPPRGGGGGARAVSIGGLDFPSISAAARALGVSRPMLARALAGRSEMSRQRVLGAAMAYRARTERRAG